MTIDNTNVATPQARRRDDRARPPAGRARPVYTRVQALGLGLVGTTLTVIAVLVIVTDPASTGEVLVYLAPVAIATLAAGWLAWRFSTWARVVGVVVGLAAAAMLTWTVHGLAAADSVADFSLGVGVWVGVLLGVGGGLAALASGRRGRLEAARTVAERRLMHGAVALVGAAVATSSVLTVVGRTAVDPTVAAGAPAVEMTGFAFEPAEIHVDAADARLVVTNRDPFVHDFTVPALGAAVRLTPRSTASLDLSGAAPGTYTVYCTLHSDTTVDDPEAAGMAARLIVR